MIRKTRVWLACWRALCGQHSVHQRGDAPIAVGGLVSGFAVQAAGGHLEHAAAKVARARRRSFTPARLLVEVRVGGVIPTVDAVYDIVDHCCYPWNTLIDQPWKIMSIARRDWAAVGHSI